MVMNSQDGGGKNNRKNGNGMIRRIGMWGVAIVSIIVISVFISSQIGGSYRKDWQIEQNAKILQDMCAQVKEIEVKIKQLELAALEQKTETAQRLKTLEITIEKIDNSLDKMKTDMAVIKEIDKMVKKLAGN